MPAREANQLRQAIRSIVKELDTLPRAQQLRISRAFRTLHRITGITIKPGKTGFKGHPIGPWM
jgi:hypothetical protein